MGFPGGTAVNNLPAKAGGTGDVVLKKDMIYRAQNHKMAVISYLKIKSQKILSRVHASRKILFVFLSLEYTKIITVAHVLNCIHRFV